MATQAKTEKHPSRQESLVGRTLHQIWVIFLWLAAALIFSVIIEWIGMLTWWEDEGVNHSKNMLVQEIGYLNDDFRETVVTSHPAKFAKSVSDFAYEWMYENTGFISFIEWLERPEIHDDSSFRLTIKSIYEPVSEFIYAGMTITQVFAVRIAVLVLAIPAFLIFAIIGLTDGLVERDLRRWGGGRESSFVYHWAKRPILPIIAITWIIYLGMPVSVHPNYVILPFAMFFGLLVAITASRFKKYL